MQAEALRDSFPPSDKSLSKLLGESPYLPKSVLKILENMCSPGNGDKAENESHTLNADRVTQGLSAVWSLILLRPPIRDACLKIALQVFLILFILKSVVLFLCSCDYCPEKSRRPNDVF
jgi:symplekin